MKLDDLVRANRYEEQVEVCPGCDNHCTVRAFRFQNGRVYYSGNNCEKVYANESVAARKGENMFEEKYKLLFRREPFTENSGREGLLIHRGTRHSALKIGLPRALGIYENYPFWHALFTHCGIKVVLSRPSSNRLYESGARTIMADNICYPAKLMHGHVLDLVSQGVDRIFYPYVIYERKEDEASKNSFNCPIVSAYADVIRSAIDPDRFDTLPLTLADPELEERQLVDYLKTLGVEKSVAREAVVEARRTQAEYLDRLEQRGLEILRRAEQEGRMVIMLSGRPYHTDPAIEHKISYAIAAMGIDVITEHAARHAGSGVYEELNALCQWAYPNRIFKAAYFVGRHNYPGLHFVELTSFGCGPDAFILDEVGRILNRFGRNLTTLKIDDVNNIGSLRLRIRSLVESTKLAGKPVPVEADRPWTTKIFDLDDRRRTLLAPFFAEGYSELLPSLFRLAGYEMVTLPMGCQEDAERGLEVANNDICYPATIVVGSIIRALESGKYNLDETAVIITQTGGQCRASNYYSLIKNAMVARGFADVPVVSLALGQGLSNQQPGFTIEWRRLAAITIDTMLYADCLWKLYYPAVVRERRPGAALRLKQKYTEMACPFIAEGDRAGLRTLLGEAVSEFTAITDASIDRPVVGLVGEIYVKYNSFSNKHVADWLVGEGVEVLPPALSGFFSTSLVSQRVNRELGLKQERVPRAVYALLHSYLRRRMHAFDRMCRPFPLYRDFVDIDDYAALSRQVINPAADFGEGWFLPGEICHMAEHGVSRVVSLQPFGCIANHIISKGIEKRIKALYPAMNLLFLDFDSSTSEANVMNRLKFLINND